VGVPAGAATGLAGRGVMPRKYSTDLTRFAAPYGRTHISHRSPAVEVS
jgi:hypothetical protein